MTALMNIFIVDDEQPARQRLERLLQSIDTVTIVAQATNGQQALDTLKKLTPEQLPDVMLLDISMPVMTGMQLATIMSKDFPTINVIFTTAYDEYALRAFDVNAQDYLLKPIRSERLEQALQKVRDRLPAREAKKQFLSVKDRDALINIDVQDILCLHADQKYTEVHLVNRLLLANETLKQLEEKFTDTFIRIHRATLVNREQLQGMSNEQGTVHAILRDSELRPEISRRHQSEIRQFLQSKSA